MKRWFRRLAKIFLGLCLFWTLVHVVEDWRGKRAWEAWQKDQIAKGAIYDPAQLHGPPIPDADNFAKAPIIQGLLGEPKQALFPTGFRLDSPKTPVPGWRTGHKLDLQPWMDANHTQDLKAFLAPIAPRLEELADAARRPGSRFEVPKAESDLATWPLSLRSPVRVLSLQALIALRSGKPDDALEDVLIELRLTRQVGQDPTLLAQTIQLTLSSMAMQPIWEGLQTHAWDEGQLTRLEEELSRQDELTPFLDWGRGERISTNQYWSGIAESPWWDRENPGSVVGHALIPRGWFYRNMLTADQHLAETWLAATDPRAHRVYPDRARAIAEWWNQRRSTPYTLLAKHISLMSEAVAEQTQRFAAQQVALDEALTVCALERYRLAHKVYPDSLDALVPAYAAKLPCDVFTGAPLHYACKGDGFTLYSVGWNGKDEGGVMAMDGKNRDLSNGDLPWPEAAR